MNVTDDKEQLKSCVQKSRLERTNGMARSRTRSRRKLNVTGLIPDLGIEILVLGKRDVIPVKMSEGRMKEIMGNEKQAAKIAAGNVVSDKKKN